MPRRAGAGKDRGLKRGAQKIEITASSEIAAAMAAQAQQRTTSCMTLRVPLGTPARVEAKKEE